MSKTLASFVGLLALLLGATVSTQTKADSDFKVTLLGTGTPIPDPDRFGPSTLVEAGNQKLLFDAGRGVPIRVQQLGFRESKIDVVFLTHYHSDHTVGIPDIWLTGWLGNRRQKPFRLIGPVGAKSLMANWHRNGRGGVREGWRRLRQGWRQSDCFHGQSRSGH